MNDLEDATLESPTSNGSTSTRRSHHTENNWRQMNVGDDGDREKGTRTRPRCLKSLTLHAKTQCELMNNHRSILLISFLIFAILSGAGIALCRVVSESSDDNIRQDALDLAEGTGAWFAKELDSAILPLFSMAQFATEIELFAGLPDQIGQANEPDSLPFVTTEDGSFNPRRNITGVCDQPEIVKRFTEIASAIKTNAKMDGVLHNIQLAPQGVICLLHPLNNTEDFDDGSFLDSTAALGIDILNDPFLKYIARASMKQEDIGIAGPRPLTQCPTCGLYFIARLPVRTENHRIDIDGISYNRWGFATALINWDALVNRSEVHDTFEKSGYEFQLTRTDRNFNAETDTYDEVIVVLAESERFGTKAKRVSTALQTTNNEWVMTVWYDDNDQWMVLIIAICVFVAFCIAFLVYVVLIQKQVHSSMKGKTMAQDAKVEIERNMTAYFAHELRNPLGAIDSALISMPDGLPEETKDLIGGMKLCSTFMSSIMNNLLDVRKMEEGKVILHSSPLSLKRLVGDVHKMALPTVSPGVDLLVVANTERRDWVLGDVHRLQQILTNLGSNAIKYTKSGSVTIVASWEGDSVRLECQDTGPGIPKCEQEHMFERFTQRGGAPGSGLGLAIAKQMVGLMGGSIRFDSDPTVKPGTNCIVLLPLKLCEEPVEKECKAEDALPLEEPLSILIIDDVKMNRSMLKRRFQKGIAPNCAVSEAAKGEEALVLCGGENFDVIIVDQYMEEAGGVMLGTDVIIAMRRSKLESIIIGCSGNDLDDQFRAAGADLIWKKPMPSNLEIIRQLRYELGRRERSRFSTL